MVGIGERIMLGTLKLTNLIEKYTEPMNLRKKLEHLGKELMTINLTPEKYATMESCLDERDARAGQRHGG